MTVAIHREPTILDRCGAKVTPTSLTLTNPDLPYELLEELCAFVGDIERSCYWWQGDILVAAEHLHGEVFAQLEAVTGLAPQSLVNRASVCRHIPPSRRHPRLRPSIHEVVAYLEPAEQDRYLHLAETEGWTRSQLREQVKADRNGGITEDPVICRCDRCGNEHRP